ncbi:MAG: 2-iminoacetate synthase ThiH [Lentisphaeria bacterium]
MIASTFTEVLEQWPVGRVADLLNRQTESEVDAAVNGDITVPVERLAALLSPAAEHKLESLAQASAALTRQRFGNTLQFYAPLYVSNYCCNSCRYCGFNRGADVKRRALTIEEALQDAEYLAQVGFRHILLVSGEDPAHVPISYFETLVRELSGRFASISIEIYPLDENGYRRLVQAGVNGLTLYQESYDPKVYRAMHPAGPKRDYQRRLQTIEAGAKAGMHSLGIGALLGLTDWRTEMFYVGLHGLFLWCRYWRQKVSVSFPRMRHATSGIAPECLVDDTALVQMICALRLVLPDAGLVLSTRESAELRDHLLPLGITRLSAASVTEPGGYSQGDDDEAAGQQFEVQDHRSLTEMTELVRAEGFDPVFKDWDAAYRPVASNP